MTIMVFEDPMGCSQMLLKQHATKGEASQKWRENPAQEMDIKSMYFPSVIQCGTKTLYMSFQKEPALFGLI